MEKCGFVGRKKCGASASDILYDVFGRRIHLCDEHIKKLGILKVKIEVIPEMPVSRYIGPPIPKAKWEDMNEYQQGSN